MKLRHEKAIARSYQKWLALLVFVAFMLATIILWVSQTQLSEKNAINLMRLNILDVRQDIVDASNENLLKLTRLVAREIDAVETVDEAVLQTLAQRYDVAEINLVDENGLIIATTHSDFLHYDMASGAQSGEFLVLLHGEEEFVQSYQPTTHTPELSRKYGGVALESGGFVQVGYDAERFREDINSVVTSVTRNRHVGEGGCIIIADTNWNIVSDPAGREGSNLSVTGIWIDQTTMPPNQNFTARVYGVDSYCMYLEAEGYYAVAVMPQNEVVLSRDVSVGATLTVELVVFAALFVMVYVLTKRLIVNNLQKVNGSLAQITGGNLDAMVDVRSHKEFSSLSDDINATVDTLKRYIADAAARIDAELEFARTIQYASLPSVFPPYPNRTDFDIWAGMDTAKEVGGDFYDFYLLGEDHFAFLIADVSGKGIPAAMFMMSAKSVLKSLAEGGMQLEEVFRQGNQRLCEGNDTGMFLTAWMGVLNTRNGLLRFVNAGHNPPLLRRRDGQFEYLKARSGFALAGMEGMRYRPHEVQLAPGDEIFLYTDGVTEASDMQQQFYGEERLQAVLNRSIGMDAKAMGHAVQADLEKFVGEAEQFDDITMLSLQYKGAPEMYEIILDAVVENIDTVTDFVNAKLETIDCPMKAQMQIDVAIDELFGNIARYAYPEGNGQATVQLTLSQAPTAAEITFIDSGIPFDPLAQKEPDTTLSAEERGIGGLGIHLVKKTMSDVRYARIDGKNILTIRKVLN